MNADDLAAKDRYRRRFVVGATTESRDGARLFQPAADPTFEVWIPDRIVESLGSPAAITVTLAVNRKFKDWPTLKRDTREEAFAARIDTRDPSRCWNWTGGLTRRGGNPKLQYGGPRRDTILGHRLSWEIHFGPIPDGHDVERACGNRLCVNPAHLKLNNQPITKCPDGCECRKHSHPGHSLGGLNRKRLEVEYTGMHDRVVASRGRPSVCEQCGTTDAWQFEWALKHDAPEANLRQSTSRQMAGRWYSVDIYDYMRLCTRCHAHYDRPGGRVGKSPA